MKHAQFWRFCLLVAPSFAFALTASAQEPEWIWSTTNSEPGKQTLFFRKTFTIKDDFIKAMLSASADDTGEFFINGKHVGNVKDFQSPAYVDISKDIVRGENVIAVQCDNKTSYGGLLARIDVTIPTSGTPKWDPHQHAGLRWIVSVVSDPSWTYSDQASPHWKDVTFDDASWKHPVSEGKIGVKPWGMVFTTRAATAAETIKVMPGFKVELLHSADPTEGSWSAMVADDKGRIIVSPQGDEPMTRYTISHGHISRIDRIEQPVHSAMGLLYVDHSLFVNGHGPKGTGIYRLRAKGDGFAAPVLLRNMKGEGEHGSHGLVLGPDGKLYVVSGNFTKIPGDILPTSPMRNYADDQLLPRAPDGRGFGNGLLPPGGFVIRMDLSGSNCELFAAGTRNTYDIAFNPQGELFGFDSDMEWDWGSVWYRPTRVNHWIAGGNYGFREGSGKFPEYYEDTLPANLNIGIGSPTGIRFGTDSNFPEKYRTALFMLDWAYGRIFAVHLTPDGATYGATVETILRGSPLNLTALDFGKDGAMYFTTGGRATESGLYRLTYVGPKIKPAKPTEGELLAAAHGQASRDIRHELEAYDGQHDARIVDKVWPYLSSEDRWIRYAARTALEFQDYGEWKDRAIHEQNPFGGLTALLALARCAPSDTQRDLLLALKKFPLDQLTPEQKLLKLRVIELSFIRQGRPVPDLAKLAIEKLDPHYPSTDEFMNRELCQILLYLNAPDAITKTLDLLDKAPTQEEQTEYVLRLRTITNGWTLDQRRHYLSWFGKNRDKIKHSPEILEWFADAGRDYSDGASLSTFLSNFKDEAIATLSPEERDELAEFIPAPTSAPKLIAHKTFKDWRVQDIEPDLDKIHSHRNFARGRKMYTEAGCILCHKFGRTGGAVGPELAAVGSRLTARDILESIILPSKVVSEQYENTIITKKDGDDVIGRIANENDQTITVITDPIKSTKVVVKKSDISGRRLSKVSPMPEGLANFMKEDQILDLIAYLQSGGKRDYAAFKK